MASWFRSMDMQYVSIIVNEDAAHSCIKLIGQIGTGVVQFTDLNDGLTAFQRRYVGYMKRCDELERKLKYFSGEITSCGIPVQTAGSVDEFLRDSTERGAFGEAAKSGAGLLEHLEGMLEQHEAHLRELNGFNATLFESYNRKVELQQVLNKTQDLMMGVTLTLHAGGSAGFNERGEFTEAAPTEALLGDRAMDLAIRFSSTAGVIPQAERARFERTLFRATRGNCFFEFMDVDQPLTDPSSGAAVHKAAFVIFYKSATIEAKIRKICDAFGARTYALPDLGDKQAIDALRARNAAEIKDSATVLAKNVEQRQRMCTFLAQNVAEWSWTVLRERAIYGSLNMFKADVSGMLRAEGWVVEARLNDVRGALNKSHENMGHGMVLEPMPKGSWPTPPTHFDLNKFTSPFQEFVDTYGVPRYKEANPALFTAATFPFLFGVMYGDIGHGSVLLLGALYLVSQERQMETKKQGEMAGAIFSARYMLLLMGIMAVYAGLIYNDFFALALNLFGSSYEWLATTTGDDAGDDAGDDGSSSGNDDGIEYGADATMVAGCSYGDGACVYPFGVDPAWHISGNELLFFNSMKMKMSVILGICQMTLGICLKGLNAHYFGEKLDFYFEFLPMMVFNLCFFGYMVFIIFLKWSINWDERMYSATCNEDNHKWPSCDGAEMTTEELCPLDYGGSGDGCQPPNLITTLMNMALAPGDVDDPLYSGQASVQVALLLLAGASVPVLLLAKPLIIKSQMGNADHDTPSSFSETPLMHHGGDDHDDHWLTDANKERDLIGEGGEGGGGHEEHDFGEVLIHQAIETIEFVLGMVSNTASYLRLWALSLAHTELASVFWEKCLLSALNMGNPVALVAGYAVFAAVTFAVLLAMDVLECFLHAVRLQWVEFQNKFYKADGRKFSPLCFRKILVAADF